MKKQSVSTLAEILFEAATRAPKKDISHICERFIYRLIRIRQKSLLPQICVRLQELSDKREGIVRVRTVASRELPKSIQHAFEERFGAKIEFEHTIDPSVVGGLRFQIGDTIVDGTVAATLKKLYA